MSGGVPQARVKSRGARPFQLVWLIPLVAVAIAGWLGYQELITRGSQIRIGFSTAESIAAGQTKVKHRSVDLGTVQAVRLSRDLKHIEVSVDMTRQADPILTDNARFWVVRPRLTIGNVSGLDTLVSGAYIEMDPGAAGAPRKLDFQGLDEPPAVRSGEPGRTFNLTAKRIGSISSGSPVFFRDIVVGEVLGYDLGSNGDQVTVHTFVRSPFDGYVTGDTHFWNVSGVSVDLGAQGVRLQLESIQAILAGGIAFDTGTGPQKSEPSPDRSAFPLYPNLAAAEEAGYSQRIKLVTYIEGSVRGLALNAPVELYGIQVGSVTGIQLDVAGNGSSSRVVVHMEVQPERFQEVTNRTVADALPVTQTLVRRGMRAQVRTANFVTGQMLIAFDFQPDAKAADVKQVGEEIVVPSVSGGLDSLTNSLAQVANKLEQLPLDQIGGELTSTLRGISGLVNGPEIRQTLQSVSAASKELPGISHAITQTADRSGKLLVSVDAGYGEGSEFRREIDRLMAQITETARSVRLLTNYLNEHPEALIRGRTDRSRN